MSGRLSIQGMDKARQLDPKLFQPDVRPTMRKFTDWIRQPENMVISMFMATGAAWYYPAMAQLIVPAMLPFVMWGLNRKENTVLKMPVQSGMLDPNEINPSNGKAMKAQGIFCLGNDLVTGKEIWLTNDDCRQHFLVLGTTGAGKATSVNSRVHTPAGWKRMGDLKTGDYISCPVDGESCSVIGVFPQGLRKIWTVFFDDGRRVEVDAEHLWEVDTEESTLVITTREMLERFKKDEKMTIPVTAPLRMNGVFGNAYQEGKRLGHVAINSYEIRIPDELMLADVPDRESFLDGVIDAAILNRDEISATILTHGEEFAIDVVNLARSLGYKAYCDDYEPDSSGNKKGIVHVIFRNQNQPLRLAVIWVAPDTSVDEAVCIMVDHPRHLYVMDNYVVTHNTELLIGFAANAISWGSGLLYCDGKGDVSLFAKMYALARKFGREDDLLVLNFMNGNKDDTGGDGRVRSNTLNPFADGASDALTQMIVGLMAEAGGDGAMWKGRAVAMLTGVIKALVWLRNKGELDLNVGTIREYMNLKNIISLASEKDRPSLPRDIRTSVRAYLTSLPGFVESKGTAQAQTTLDQHGYLEMQFSQIFGSLNDVYGHIFRSAYGQIDMSDVVLNRRILVIMLPALEKSGDEIANLGKIVAANLKGMMGGTLGSNLEGSWDEVVERRPTSAPSPFLCILDEVGYYTVDGMALMAAQARSLGFSMVYASQDIPAMQRNNEKEAASIIANTNTKIFMRTEEADKTGALAVNSGGEAHRVTLGDMEKMDSEMGSVFRNGKSVRFEEKKRISFLDLKSQGPGELTITYKGEIVRGKAFYADPSSALDKGKLKMRANHFIEVVRPDPNILTKEEESIACMNLIVDAGHEEKMAAAVAEAMEGLSEAWAGGSEIAIASKMWTKCIETVNDPITASGCVVAQLGNSMSGAIGRSGRDMAEARNPRGRMPSRMDEFPDEDFGPGHPDMVAEDYMGASNKPMAQKRSKVDSSVKHGVSVDGKESWDAGKGLSNKREIIKCLADLDFDFDENAKSPQEIDRMMDENLNVGEKTPGDAAIPARAQQFEDIARSMEEIKTDPELPPRREPASSAVSSEKKDGKKTKDEGDEGSEGSSGGKSSDGTEKLVEDFISQLMGGT